MAIVAVGEGDSCGREVQSIRQQQKRKIKENTDRTVSWQDCFVSWKGYLTIFFAELIIYS